MFLGSKTFQGNVVRGMVMSKVVVVGQQKKKMPAL
jgi:hypothetical protein